MAGDLLQPWLTKDPQGGLSGTVSVKGTDGQPDPVEGELSVCEDGRHRQGDSPEVSSVTGRGENEGKGTPAETQKKELLERNHAGDDNFRKTGHFRRRLDRIMVLLIIDRKSQKRYNLDSVFSTNKIGGFCYEVFC